MRAQALRERSGEEALPCVYHQGTDLSPTYTTDDSPGLGE